MTVVDRCEVQPARVTRPRGRVGQREDLITLGVSLWLVGGIFLDGWAHNNLVLLESFFTPWHAVLYSGYVAVVVRMGWLLGRRGGTRSLAELVAAIPRGYELGLVGALLFGVAGVGDMLWHLAFGIERNLAALLSPTHLVLFLSAILMLTSPLRSAWSDTRPGADAPGLRAFAAPLLSIAATTALLCLILMPLWGTGLGWPLEVRGAFGGARAQAQVDELVPLGDALGLASILTTNVMLLAPVLLLLRRWRLPFGSVTVQYTIVAGLMESLYGFAAYHSVISMILAGVAADGLIWSLRPSPARVAAFRLFASVSPLVLWSVDVLSVQLRWGALPWPPELWLGAVVLSCFGGFGLSLLALPPADAVSSPR